MTEQYITVGEIVNTQGIRGEVRVLPTTDYPERFQSTTKILVLLRDQRLEYTIEKVWPHKQFIIVKFAEIPDLNAAEKMKGALLQITRKELVALPKDNYYIFDLVGLKVYEEGRELGELVQVLKTGANDVYVIKPPEGKDLLLPALKSVVKEIDLERGKMEVKLPDGLI
ncbi:ribosome maturation factor RimM [Desulforamulus ruminis]|uniref:Ribosome maturation factor RimM n=1 Tax=Desulforamulus ruminis (strain ATCC 23193 / DSM 2154 / NCIMB 8452 / DL) TaxID=696281 RepID=F6DTK3_DESRL|nr:ribosome maturation factor RimM [Desulforamulus ruminis]AEG60065.1 16S rRNA processing protein RimM [Desulforamulus ruminis DSM 2154]